MTREALTLPRRDSNPNTERLREAIELTRGNLGAAVKYTAYSGTDWNLDVHSVDTTAGLIARFSYGVAQTALSVTKDGISAPDATFADLIVTNDAQVGNDLSVARDIGVGRDVGIVRNLTVGGNSTLGNAPGDTVAMSGDASVAGNLGVTGNIVNDGLTAFGNADTDTHTRIGNLTVKNLANTLTPLFADVLNGRTIVGSVTALTSAADDRFTVVGGTSYFAGNSGPSIGLRYNASQTVGWRIGLSAAGANADLVFLDDGAVEKFRIGDSSSIYQANLTGNLFVSGAADIGGLLSTPTFNATTSATAAKIAAGTTSFSGSEKLRVVGDSRFEGAVVVTTGGVAVTGDVTHTGTWTNWTPTVTQLGALTGTFNWARYRVDGKTAHVQVQWTKDASGSGTSGNAVVLGAIPSAIQPARTGNQAACGVFLFSDAGTYTIGTAVTNSTTTMIFWFQGTTSPLGGAIAVASGDILSVEAVYEIAP